VERFLALQTMGTETARQDARTLKQTVLSLPMPDVEVLNGGLEILKTVDLREPLAALRCRTCVSTVIWTGWCRAKWFRCWIAVAGKRIALPKPRMRRLSLIRGILFSAHCVKSTFRLIIFYPSWKK
jgi:hypothetical protein